MLYGLLTVTSRIESGVIKYFSLYSVYVQWQVFALTLTHFARIASGVPSELLPLMQVKKQPMNPSK